MEKAGIGLTEKAVTPPSPREEPGASFAAEQRATEPRASKQEETRWAPGRGWSGELRACQQHPRSSGWHQDGLPPGGRSESYSPSK